MLPTLPVDGVGAEEEPVPPLDVEYHNKLEPVAVNGLALWFKQRLTGLTTGAEGFGLMVTVTGILGLSQLPGRVWLT